MEIENEKKHDDMSAEQPNVSREGYQKDYRPVGRSPRPRIHNSAPRTNAYDRPSYNRRDNAAPRNDAPAAEKKEVTENVSA